MSSSHLPRALIDRVRRLWNTHAQRVVRGSRGTSDPSDSTRRGTDTLGTRDVSLEFELYELSPDHFALRRRATRKN